MAEHFAGIGWIDTYGTYTDKMWSHGVIYYVRDYYEREITHGRNVKEAVQWYTKINSEILKYKQCPKPSPCNPTQSNS